MMFMKKRPDLPKRPDPNKEDGFSLFVEKTSGKSTPPAEILVPNGDKAEKGKGLGRGLFKRNPKDVIDVLEITDAREAVSHATPVPDEAEAPMRTVEQADVIDVEAAPVNEPADEPAVQPILSVRKKPAPVADNESPPAAETKGSAASLSALVQRFKSKKAEADEPAQEQPKKPRFGFSLKKNSSAEDAEAPPPAATPADVLAEPAHTGLSARFGRGGKKKSDATKGKKVAKAQGNAAPKRPTAPAGSFDILVELEGDRRVFWRVTANGLKQVESTQVLRAGSFSRNDHRFLSDGALNYNGARDLALSELGEECRIVNGTKARSAVYASLATRIDALTCRVGPGLQLIEELLEKNGHADEDVIAGLLLKDDDGQSLAILYHVTALGAISTPQITVNPENLGFTLSQFASSKRLDAENAQVILFKNADLLSQARRMELYPNEAVWAGLSVRRITWAGVMVAASVAAASTLYAGQAFTRIKLMEGSQSRLSSKVAQVDKALQKKISGSLVTFARTQSVDIKQVTQRAGDLWEPHTKVTLEATLTSEKYDVLMPLTRGTFNNRPSVLGQLTTNDIEPLIGKVPPEGCTKDIPGVSGGVDAIQITITCESPVSPIGRYRLD